MKNHILAPHFGLILGITAIVISATHAQAALTKDRNWVDDRIKTFQQIHTPQLEVQSEIAPEPRLYSDKFSQTFQTFRHEERTKAAFDTSTSTLDEESTESYDGVSEVKFEEDVYSKPVETSKRPVRVPVYQVPLSRPHSSRRIATPVVRNMSDQPTLDELKAERKRIRAVLLNGNGTFLRNSHITGEHTWGRKFKWWSKIY